MIWGTIDDKLFRSLLAAAVKNPRHRQHYDLRNSPEDNLQRMLNAILPDSVIPIHRHNDTNETVIVLKGTVEEVLYDETGQEVERYRMGVSEGIQIPQGQYHTAIALEPSVIVEFKEGQYNPETTEDFGIK